MIRGRGLVGVLALLVAAPVLAVDGVIEINQAAVFAGGITPGDTAGFPVTLSQTASYRLTGNLDVTKQQDGSPQPNAQNVDAIVVGADDVEIDLNGFAIIGPVTCSGDPTTCTPSGGTGDGISDDSSRRTTIRNGTVRGMGREGINVTGTSSIDQVRVIQNGNRGIAINHGVVRNCIAESNGDTGILANDAVVANNTSRRNGRDGFSAQDGTVTGNVSLGNAGVGYFAANSLVLGNQGSDNTGVGLDGNTRTGYGENTFNDNNSGGAQVSGGPTEIGMNVCQADTTCP